MHSECKINISKLVNSNYKINGTIDNVIIFNRSMMN